MNANFMSITVHIVPDLQWFDVWFFDFTMVPSDMHLEEIVRFWILIFSSTSDMRGHPLLDAGQWQLHQPHDQEGK